MGKLDLGRSPNFESLGLSACAWGQSDERSEPRRECGCNIGFSGSCWTSDCVDSMTWDDFSRVRARSEGGGQEWPSRGSRSAEHAGERGPWGDGASVREPNGLAEPRLVEPRRGRTDRGAWCSRTWSRGGCCLWGSGTFQSPRPTAPSFG